MSKRDKIKRLRAKRMKAPKAPQRRAQRPESTAPTERADALRPTPERIAKGGVEIPTGPGKREAPARVVAPDCVAALCVRPRRISQEQENAARHYEDLRRAVRAELGLKEGRSCLDISPVGHDDGDGDESLAAEWRRVRDKLGPRRVAVLDATVIDGKWPMSMVDLREALDAFEDC